MFRKGGRALDPDPQRLGGLSRLRPAAVLQQRSERQRLHRLAAVAAESRQAILRRAIEGNPVTEVLFETYENGLALGHTADFLEVALPSELPLHGEILPVRLIKTAC